MMVPEHLIFGLVDRIPKSANGAIFRFRIPAQLDQIPLATNDSGQKTPKLTPSHAQKERKGADFM